ncbi:aminotransferase class V-fold PLP-dependent enzyme [Sulfurospirillum sp. 1307]|jgi:cysteine desulfurase/selenocysteine lyase
MYKKYFPYFNNSKNIYLDTAATAQKPTVVIEAINEYYTKYCSNTHRSNFKDANKATTEFEKTRQIIKKCINANDSEEIIFTKGITESLNLVASSFVKDRFDTVIISSLEHHSNIVPWHMQNRSLHNGLEVVDCDDGLTFDMNHFEKLLKDNPNSFVSITHVSNAFGKIHPIKNIIKIAHQYGAVVMVDGAQGLPHFNIDMQDINADFYTISGHKTYGPTGVGALYANKKHLKDLRAYQTGGATISDVSYDKTTLLDAPFKFEAGTQNIAGVIGFQKSIEFLQEIGYPTVISYENEIYEYLYESLKDIEDIIFYTDSINSIGSLSFNIKGIMADDLGILLDKMNVSIRAGHHCAQPIMKKLNINGTLRVSLGIYNDKEDIDIFINKLKRAINILKD